MRHLRIEPDTRTVGKIALVHHADVDGLSMLTDRQPIRQQLCRVLPVKRNAAGLRKVIAGSGGYQT